MNTEPAGPMPSLDEVKSRILSDHRQIRALLDEVASAAASVPTAPQPEGWLTDLVWRLFVVFDNHLRLEERELVPRLVDTGAWGTILVQRFEDEHSAQRAVLMAMIRKCDAKKDAGELADDARWLVAALRRDITSEEEQLEKLRDDGFVVDQITG